MRSDSIHPVAEEASNHKFVNELVWEFQALSQEMLRSDAIFERMDPKQRVVSYNSSMLLNEPHSG